MGLDLPAVRCLALSKHLAFTLAELLIALGILGILATMTIPKVLQANMEARKRAVFKETISMLVGADQAAARAGAWDEISAWSSTATERLYPTTPSGYNNPADVVFQALNSYINSVKACSDITLGGAWPSSEATNSCWNYYHDSWGQPQSGSVPTWVLANGAKILVQVPPEHWIGHPNGPSGFSINLWIDWNGTAGPNQAPGELAGSPSAAEADVLMVELCSAANIKPCAKWGRFYYHGVANEDAISPSIIDVPYENGYEYPGDKELWDWIYQQ